MTGKMQHRAVPLALLVALAAPAAVRAQQDQPTPTAAMESYQRRGWWGISLSCEECLILRGGRVAYTRFPQIYTVESGTPAALAGLRNGDTLVAVEGQLVTTPEGFERFASALPNVAIRVTVRNRGEHRDVTVTPADRSSATTVAEYIRQRTQTAQRRGMEALRSSFRSPMGWLGVSLECEGCSLSRMSATFRTPPAVAMVDVESPAARAGLRRGDTIIAIDSLDLTTRDGGRAFASIEPSQRMTLTVRRDGRERRVPIVAVMRPDASREEVAAYNEYRSYRDSAETRYRQLLTAHSARVAEEMRLLAAELREMEASRLSVEEARRRVSRMDSVLRAAARAEREFDRSGSAWGVMAVPARAPKAFAGTLPGQPVPPVAAVAPVAPTAAVPPTPPAPGGRFPLRYSNRIGNVNVEARAPGPVSVSEVGDSLIVVHYGGVEVRIQRRGR